ncbi:MAG: spiro-SPASM protein [Treponema sp.]|jgi:spiro-SPASM protein|nr:spiro-SPASM protein [Treponema sp.]
MNALTVLFAGRLEPHAWEPVFSGKNALALALEQARQFPGTAGIILLGRDGEDYSGLDTRVELVLRPRWTKKSLLESLSGLSQGFDLSYFAWADCPFLDPALAGAIAERHIRYAAEYSYADGWPAGFSPELLAPGVAGILLKILGDEDGPVERDCLFSVLQKDINAFDIETEISPADLRQHRLNLAADSKRNLLLLTRFIEAAGGVPAAKDAEGIIAGKPGILRTLPNFYPVQVSGPCAQSCSLCPYPRFSSGGPVTERRDFMDPARFEGLLEKIIAFSGDAVIDLSLWGELALHPQKLELFRMVLARPELALVVETSGLGWKAEELEAAQSLAAGAAGVKRKSPLPPLSWIVSLDAADPRRYREVRGPGFAEAMETAKGLFALFPADTYVQAIRTEGAEDDIEQFYRSWKETAPRGAANIIIQKYDDFCGALSKKQASDLSPVVRQPCWHIMRDLPVLIDGRVPRCREDLSVLKAEGPALGNVFTDPLEEIWGRGLPLYDEQSQKNYRDLCAGCDEYYTYNF